MHWLKANEQPRSKFRLYLKKENRTPVIGIEFNPTTEGVDDQHLEFKWYRNVYDMMENCWQCCVHGDQKAQIYCITCDRLNLPLRDSYHCTPNCYYNNHTSNHWENGDRVADFTDALVEEYRLDQNNLMMDDEGEFWLPIGNSKVYFPTRQDWGCMLRLEIRTTDPINPSVTSILLTKHVIEAPCPPPPRSLIPVGSIFKFKVMSYNILLDFMIIKKYDHCPEWCQTWEFRRKNLLREISSYEADIICLQELQDTHFEHYFKPKLEKLGYCAKFKAKLFPVRTYEGEVRDGCATFFRKDRFREVREYELIFPKIARAFLDRLGRDPKDKRVINWPQDNVALVTILEFLDTDVASNCSSTRLCVVNTQIYANEAKKEIKLWQVATLMTRLDSIADSNVPVLICGDLNSCPGSAPYDLVVHGKIDRNHPEWPDDPLEILDHTKLHHRMHLVSAYRFWRASEEQINSGIEEPQFTTFTKYFSGVLDYIFYSEDTLKLLGLLELLDANDIARNGYLLPSSDWSSDHVALLAEFCLKPK